MSLDWVVDHPRWVFGGLLVLVVVAGSGATRLTLNNSPDVWLPARDPELDLYQRFTERFGSDATLLVASGPIELQKEPALSMAWLELEAQLRAIEGVRSIENPWVDGLDGIAPRPEDGAAYLVSEDGRSSALLLALQAPPSERVRVLEAVQRTVDAFSSSLGSMDVVGTDVVTQALDRGSASSLGSLFPWVILTVMFVVGWSLRSPRLTLAILMAAVGSAVVTLGCMGWAGVELNLVVVIVPAILAVLTVAAALHLGDAFGRGCAGSSPSFRVSAQQASRRWKSALGATIVPCTLTTLTTVGGFGSLATSPIGPIKHLGVFTALGAIWVLVFVFGLLPILAPRARTRVKTTSFDDFLQWLRPRRGPILWATAVVAVSSAAGLFRLRVESNVLEFFPPEHHLPKAYRAFEARFFGLTTFEIWAEGPVEQLASPKTLRSLDQLARSVLEGGLASDVIDPATRTRGTLPARAAWLAFRLEQMSTNEPYLWRSEDGSVAAIRQTLAANTGSSNRAYNAVKEMRRRIAVLDLPEDVSVRLSGATPLLVRGQVLLLETQIRSFLLALGVVSVIVLMLYRDLRIGLISLVPNILPIAFVLGIMGWIGIPLDVGTVTVAGIALGLVVDDTLHFLHHYRAGEAGFRGLTETLRRVGRPIVTTSLAVVLGFGIFAVSSFRPTLYFGLLLAMTASLALVCDLLVLPALLLKRQAPKGDEALSGS
ncbi:MAG: RND family transporter [Myxococcota bacterium]